MSHGLFGLNIIRVLSIEFKLLTQFFLSSHLRKYLLTQVSIVKMIKIAVMFYCYQTRFYDGAFEINSLSYLAFTSESS